MNKMNKMKINTKSGFSLMELIIVIVIIGILISAVVGLNGQKETAKISAAEQVIIQLSNAAQSWAVMQASENFTKLTTSDKTLKALTDTGILPQNFNVEKANPWAGLITFEKASSVNHYVIKLTNVPETSCVALSNKFGNKTFIPPKCGSTGTDPKKTTTLDLTF